MSEAEDRKLAADVTRAIGGGIAAGIGVAVPGLGPVLGAGVSLAAKLIEELGVSKAEEKLKALVDNPAPLITKSDLDAQTASVIEELGG